MRNNVPSQKNQPTPTDYVDPEAWGPDPAVDESQVLRPLAHQTTVLPYRGQEYHGVNPNLAGEPPDINADVFDQRAVVPEKQKKPDEVLQPVPVKIVNTDAKEYKRFNTDQWRVSTQAVGIAGYDSRRTSLVIKNTDAANTVYIGNNSSVMSTIGYPLSAGESVSLETTSPVYAIAPSGDATLALLHEISVS